MSITMKELAKLANVDTSTVSRALNGHPAISAQVRDDIKKLARRHNYQKRRTRRKTLAYFIDKDYFLNDSQYFNAIIESMETSAKENGYMFRFISIGKDDCNGSRGPFDTKDLAGALITSYYRKDLLDALDQENIPVVLVDYYLPGRPYCSILTDSTYGIMRGFEYLHNLGHRRIAYITGNTSRDVEFYDRLVTFRRAHEIYSVPLDESLVVQAGGSISGGYEATAELLSRVRPTAVMCSTDVHAIGALEAVKQAGLSIPGDISILGFDGIDLGAEVIPSLSTVSTPQRTIGGLAVGTLCRLMDGEQVPCTKMMVKPELVIRQSTGLCKVREHEQNNETKFI